MLKRLRAALVLPLVLLPGLAAAQFDGWAVMTQDDDPMVVALAVHCPINDPSAGQAFCLSVGCTPNEPFSLGFTYAGYGPLVGRDFPATLTVDGTGFAPVSLRRIAVGSLETIAAAYVEADHAALLDALRRGQRLSVRFEGDVLPPQDMPLNRSLVSIDRARALCAASDAVPATTIIGQRLDIWEMLAGNSEDDHLLDVLPDGSLRVTLNGVESQGSWTRAEDGALCLVWPGRDGPLCGTPRLRGRNLVLRLAGPDGMLAARIEGMLVGPVPGAP